MAAATRRGKKDRTATVNVSSEEAILACISTSGTGITGLAEQVRVFVNSPPDGKPARGNEGHARAKKLVPFLVRLLKQCGSELKRVPAQDDSLGHQRGSELFGTMGAALDALDSCRAWLVGNPIEIELQRYTFLRRLLSWKRYAEAGEEGRKIFRSLNANVFSARDGKKGSGNSRKVVDRLVLLPPKSPNDSMADLPVLVAGVTSDLILSVVESGNRNLETLQELVGIPPQLEPWISVMNKEDQESHRESVFKVLYRVAAVLVSESSLQPDLLFTFCSLALDWCMRSSQREQYLKVTRKLCSSMISQDSLSVFALRICEIVVSNLVSLHEERLTSFQELMLTSDELRWLISAAYNIGVHIYNKKQYDSACKPLGLAHDVAWARVEALSKRLSGDNQVVAEAVVEACVKTSAFVDCRRRTNNERATSILTNALVRWSRVHSQNTELQVPQNLIRLWCKMSEGTLCLHDSLKNVHPPLPAASLGLLLEEQLLTLDMECTGLDNVETTKETIMSYLINVLYEADHFVVEKSTILIERSRIARRQGVRKLATCISLLSDVVELSNKAWETAEASRQFKLKLEYQRAVGYSLRAHCTQEENPFSKDFMEDVVLAIKSWEMLVLHIADWSCLSDPRRKTMSHPRESALRLLRSLADLLCLKAMSSLQNQVEVLILDIAMHDRETFETDETSTWENARLSHLLCAVPVSESFHSFLATRFPKADVLFEYAKRVPSSLAYARQLILCADFSAVETSSSQQFLLELNTAITSASTASSSRVQECVGTSAMKFYLAEVYTQLGEMEAALSYAVESLQLRFKLLHRTFSMLKEANGDPPAIRSSKFEASAVTATTAWPSSFNGKSACEISQWHVLSDYIESLMQVGVLHERLGSADEAEKSFREGLNLAQAQNIPFACMLFASCLGEVHRKQHLWDKAEEHLHTAEKSFEDLDISSTCANCVATGKAHLELRLGDFVRHSSLAGTHSVPSTSQATGLDNADVYYQSAEKVLHVLSIHGDPLQMSMRTPSYSDWIRYRWQLYGRRLMARVLLQQGKSMFQSQNFREAEDFYLRAKKALNLNTEQLEAPHLDKTTVISGSMYPLEEAALLYHWSLLLCRQRSTSSEERVLSRLYRAFCLCSSAPLLFKKVCQLLSVLYVLELAIAKNGSESRNLAAYFHQASIGSMSRQQHLLALHSNLEENYTEDSCVREMRKVLKLIPGARFNLGTEFKSLMQGLPSATVCCISLVEKDILTVSEKLKVAATWLLFSRFGDGDVIVNIVPIGCAAYSPELAETVAEPERRRRHRSLLEADNLVKSIMAELAAILHESRQSTSRLLPLSTVEEKSRWWKWRTTLDHRLASYLRDVEDDWFGPWKCLLLGEPTETTAFQKQAKELCKMLKSRSFLGQSKLLKSPEEGLVKVVLQGVSSLEFEQLQDVIASMFAWRREDEQESVLIEKASEAFRRAFATALDGEGLSLKPRRTSRKASEPRPVERSWDAQTVEREPVELVLDGRLQVLPWESLPVMRKVEAYRMPSLGSIKAVFLHHKHSLELLGRAQTDDKKSAVNPHDAFYLLNPGGDLESTQSAFEDWFRLQKGWEGKTGEVPTIEEYMAGLQQHDLFVYLGHGSGDQYFPEKYMRRLKACPASLLMGCSSGRFSARGEYEPVGVPLSYLMAGCPLAVANLWDVTDGDIDRFSRAVLQRWLESSGTETIVKPLKADATPHSRRGRSSTRSAIESSDASERNEFEWEEICIGPSIEAGRDACKLTYLIGASPVCFGVPTVICRSKTNIN